MKRKLILSIVFILMLNVLHAQNQINGSVLNKKSNLPVEYVNIGIVGKNIGTVSDKDGKFSLLIEPQYAKDSLIFSRIGFESHSVKISELKENNIVHLKEKSYSLNKVTVTPAIFKERVFGITSESKLIVLGFGNNALGYECGLLMKNKKKAIIKSVNINFLPSTCDTIFCRLNIYEVKEKNIFENILIESIYVGISKENILKGSLHLDLKEKNIIVNGDFLVTLEQITGLCGESLYFPTSLKQKTYYRETSQGNWETISVGISLSVIADVY